MKFPDKRTPTGELEKYATGEATERFVTIAETREEAWAVRAALTNAALLLFQSENEIEPHEARILVDYLGTEEHLQSRLPLGSEQATALARLIRLGASAMPEVLRNQFDPRQNKEGTEMDDEKLTNVALAVADAMDEEVQVREFRTGLDDLPDFLREA